MPGFALDTDGVSELVRSNPNPRVIGWISARMAGDLFPPSVVLAELSRGVRRLEPSDPRRTRYESWIARDLPLQLRDRILAFDSGAARIRGAILRDEKREDSPNSPADAHVAAVVRRYGLVVVTRYVRHFLGMGVELVRPLTE